MVTELSLFNSVCLEQSPISQLSLFNSVCLEQAPISQLSPFNSVCVEQSPICDALHFQYFGGNFKLLNISYVFNPTNYITQQTLLFNLIIHFDNVKLISDSVFVFAILLYLLFHA